MAVWRKQWGLSSGGRAGCLIMSIKRERGRKPGKVGIWSPYKLSESADLSYKTVTIRILNSQIEYFLLHFIHLPTSLGNVAEKKASSQHFTSSKVSWQQTLFKKNKANPSRFFHKDPSYIHIHCRRVLPTCSHHVLVILLSFKAWNTGRIRVLHMSFAELLCFFGLKLLQGPFL